MQGPCVSVIVPVHNGERHLAEALTSIVQQDYSSVEIIVVDDGSRDASPRIAQSFPKVRFLGQLNAGVAAARNAGVAAARSDYLAFLDQDDCWTRDKLAVQMRFLLDHPETPLVLARMRFWLDAQAAGLPTWVRPEWLVGDHPAYLPGTLLVRRPAFESVGPFEPALVTASDTDWLFRAKDAGLPLTVLPHVLLEKRIHEQNESRRPLGRQELLRIARLSIERQKRTA
jgi:glycosyltransferase involved in cell wall biosynthesis